MASWTDTEALPMKTRRNLKAKTAPRDRSNSVLIDLADLRGILERLAREDCPCGESPNMTRTVRRLIREEAERRGIPLLLTKS
jgi:hypothetical protein